MRPYSRRYWRNRRTARRWRYRLAPNPATTPEKAPPRWTTRLRRLFWHWLPWAIIACVCLATQKWTAFSVAGVMAWISFVTMPLEHSPQRGLDHEFSIADPEFLPTVAGATGHNPLPGNRLTLLNNGNEFYPAMLDAIRDAEASITIEAYIYWGGRIGREIAAALAERSRAGVAVKILLDAVGSVRVGEDVLKILEKGRCHVAWYNPLRWYTMGRFNHRTHRKSLIVDGRIGFTGGAGIADQWLGHAQDPGHWRDIQIRIEGPATRPLQTGFAQNWMQTTGELISGERYYPELRPAGPISAFTIMSSPEGGASSVRTMYYLSILCARTYIYIANSYFVPDEVATAALIDAKRRGVDVRACTTRRGLTRCSASFSRTPRSATRSRSSRGSGAG